jgi:sugar phosphate isomerase/epimerase
MSEGQPLRLVRLSRRAVVTGGALTALGAALGVAGRAPADAPRQPFFTRTGLPIGVQLYSFGNSASTDLDGTLAKVAEIGFKTVELPGFMGRTAAQLRAALDRAGLTCPSAHIAGRALVAGSDPLLGGDIHRVVEDANTLGLSYVVMPIFYIPERLKLIPGPGEGVPALMAPIGAQMTADDWKFNADFLNSKGSVLKQAGLQLAYHNHNMEFTPLAGSSGYEILLRQTDPELVKFEMDVGWVTAAGHNPLALLRDYPGRYRLMHVRDIKADPKPSYAPGQDPTEVGSGAINWKAILPAALTAGVTCYYVEQEPPAAGLRVQAAGKSFDYLKRLVW